MISLIRRYTDGIVACAVSAQAAQSPLMTADTTTIAPQHRLVDEPLLDARVGVDAAIAEERPVGAMFVDAVPFDFGRHDLFAIETAFRDDLAARRDDEALAPELDPIAAGGRFVANAIDRGDVTAVRNGMAALHRFPGRILGRAVFFL